MTGVLLQRMVENLPPDVLPQEWGGFDLSSFSRRKSLWDFQQTALHNALLALWKYYNAYPTDTDDDRKQAYMDWYQDFGLQANLDLPLNDDTLAKRQQAGLLCQYYTQEDNHIPFTQLINRMSFWMATASGKTIVIVKMIELLHGLIGRGLIPANDILVLAHRDDLLDQLKEHVEEYNANGGLFIRLCELRDYAEVKHTAPSLFRGQELTVFYYRSDNLSDEQKEKIINFRNFDNDGQWYILLDEAHKGDKEDSKRQHIYSILSRRGFLFNFSATFTDERDIVTTVSNYNLSEFIRHGHGKHIAILQQEVRAFRKADDFSEAEKQKIVLKSLIMLACIRQVEAQVRRIQSDLYHRPLMMTLVNSVSIEDADLKLFFRELVRIGNGKVDRAAFESAKQELASELRGHPSVQFESDERVQLEESDLAEIDQQTLLSTIFNAPAYGDMEILVRPSDRQEVALKLKTSDDPFALIRIGDISEWLKEELTGYEINQHFRDESFFEQLNHPNSDINILLGSRSFYEGWDSNRPNVIMYINIGTSTDAKKFILQSVGRGVRIEPFRNKRKRMRELAASGILNDVEKEIFNKVKGLIQPLESVFIFGTNREALNQVIAGLDQEEKDSGIHEISLEVNQEAINGKILLIPTYRINDTLLHKERHQSKFVITPENLDLLKRYTQYVNDDRVFYAIHDIPPSLITSLRGSFDTPDEIYKTDEAKSYRNLSVLVKQASGYFNIHGKSVSGFKEMEEEINHFRHIKVILEEIGDLQRKIQNVINAEMAINEARAKVRSNQLSFDEYISEEENLKGHQREVFIAGGFSLDIRKIANHYYIPVLLSSDERIDYIRSVIRVESEIRFLRQLEDYCGKSDNLFKQFDWWLFSRIDETLDEISIPYYYPKDNRIANFKPDFIFWLKRGNRYHILFVDPKGTGRSEYEHKIDGYKSLFEENGQPRKFNHGDLEITVHVSLYTSDREFLASGYKDYWFDSIEGVLKLLE